MRGEGGKERVEGRDREGGRTGERGEGVGRGEEGREWKGEKGGES